MRTRIICLNAHVCKLPVNFVNFLDLSGVSWYGVKTIFDPPVRLGGLASRSSTMQTDMQRVEYLVRCVNAVGELIREAARVRYLTPVQAARLSRWRAVRRSLHHDLMQAQAALPNRTQLAFGLDHDSAQAVGRWYVRQLTAFNRSTDNDPLIERVAEVSTPSGLEL